MAKEKTTETKTETREYIIPLRKDWRKVANYRRAGRAAKFIKKFIARHMKIPDRDTTKVKLDMYLNNEVWFRGKTKPPAKLKVKVIKEGDLVKVYLAETPDAVKFLKKKHEKFHKEAEKKEEPAPEEKPAEEKEEKKDEEKTPEEKKDEKEKAQAAAEQKEKQAKTQAQTQKHVPKEHKTPIHRQAMKK